MTTHHPARTQVLDFLTRGPARLVLDPNHPGCAGLAPELRNVALFLQIADTDDAVDLSDPQTFAVRHGRGEDDEAIAVVPWDAVLVLSGPGADGRRIVRVRPGALPAWLGEPGPQRVGQLLSQLGLDDSPAGQWRLGLADVHLQTDADRTGWEPDKREALRMLLERGEGHAWLLVDGTAPGIQLPPQVPRGEAMQVDLRRELPELELANTGVSWQQHGADGAWLCFVPWRCVGALRDDAGKGWFWPADLPPTVREPLEERAEAWVLAMPLQGVPLGLVAPAPVPLAFLANVQETDKERAVTACQRLGDAFVLADLRMADAALLPPSLSGRALLAVPLRLPGLDSQPVMDTEGLAATLPDPQGMLVRVQLPWKSVFLAASGQGRLRVYCWPEDYPDELSVGLFALREMALHDGVIAGPLTPGLEMGAPGPIDDGSRVGLGRSPAGDYVMVLQQPLGARQADGTRPVLQVEFCLDLPKRH